MSTFGTFSLTSDQQAAFARTRADWSADSSDAGRTGNKIARLWSKDASLWTGADESNWLGWLDIVEAQLNDAGKFDQFAKDVRERGFTHILLLGMGGSSLCPEVHALSFGKRQGFPELHVLDSTDPAQLLDVESRIDLAKTLFVVSSKSGSTLEPNIFKQYFFERAGRDGSRFIAITDPGSKMQQVAEHDGFWRVFFGRPSIGGRYSALSDFGMIPAAGMGVDVPMFGGLAQGMVHACSPASPADQNPGVVLGALLGSLALAGRDKVTIIASPGIYDLGAWLEQLIAESTGKIRRGLIPVDREPLGAPSVYGSDRVFIYERLESAPDPEQDRAVAALEAAGHPVARLSVPDVYHLGAEFFRWEIATAVAGSIIAVNPFDQPDVEAAKIATKKLTSAFEESGSLPPEKDVVRIGDADLEARLRELFSLIRAGDYFGILAYIQMNGSHQEVLQTARRKIRDSKRVATVLGFGPRFLHSTGQAYKGGPNTGVFLQITCDDARDVPVPGQKYTFGVVKAAQARGDLEVLRERGRRTLHIHLGPDVGAGLAQLASAVEHALR
ncbi:MAG TPA: bifunctional transaldolase/phosoglucose isomerase [Bryobacteraceae bacterium]|nr:bifunctional transaldolase/phosoglucose isomerase [Bryobacteraceae bacterium]